MEVGIGLPNAVPGSTGAELTEWAGHYYAWLGEEIAAMMVGGGAKDADGVRKYLAAYEETGSDALIFFPTSSDPAQVDVLADALGR
jgi:hypothetical protein